MVPMIQESFEKTARIFQATCYSKFQIFLRGETTIVLFVLISGIPLTVMLRGKCPSCIKLN